VPGHGNYEIEVTNVIDTNTLNIRPVIPCLMSNNHV